MIIGALSWFNESPAWLGRTIASLARVCDHVVAVDGRYWLFEHDMNWSPASESEAVLAAAEGAGVPLTLDVPRAPFVGNEVEKRNLVLRLALVHAQSERDWIFVCDADEYVVYAAPDLAPMLDDVGRDVVTCSLEEYFDPHTQLGEDGGIAKTMPLPNVWRASVRRLYRALPGLEYRGTHYKVGGWRTRDEWTWLDGPGKCEAYDLREHLILRHENPRRVELRRQQASTYYATREELVIESEDVAEPCSPTLVE